MKCSICEGEIEKKYTSEGEMYWDTGENAWPVTDGRCCGICNHEHVIPRRMYEHMRTVDNKKWLNEEVDNIKCVAHHYEEQTEHANPCTCERCKKAWGNNEEEE